MTYAPDIAPIIYGPDCREFDERDWIELAKAALDQARNKSNRVAIDCALEHLEELSIQPQISQ
jgi:hypothetical protein